METRTAGEGKGGGGGGRGGGSEQLCRKYRRLGRGTGQGIEVNMRPGK